MSSYDYNNAASSAETGFLEFYPFTTSPTTSSAGAVSPSSAIPVPPTTMSSAMSSPTSSRQPQTITWNLPFDFVPPVAGTAVQSPIDGTMSSPEDSPQTMSPAHISSTASSPNQQLLSPFQGTMDFNAHDSLTAVTLQQNQRQLQSSAALQLQQQQHHFLQQHRQLQQQQHHQRQLQQQQQHHQQQQRQQRQQQQQQAAAQSLQPFVQNTLMAQGFNPFAATFPNPALDYLSQAPAVTTAALEASIQLGTSFHGLPNVTGAAVNTAATGQALPYDIGNMGNWQDYELVFNPAHSLAPHRLGSVGSLGSTSPTGTNLEVNSLGSSDVDWTNVEMFPRFDAYPNGAAQSIFNPGQTLHLRSNSDSSQSEGNSLEYGSFEDISFAQPFSPFSGASDSSGSHHNCFHGDGHNHAHSHAHSHAHAHSHSHSHAHAQSHHHHRASQELVLSPAAAVSPVPIKTAAASASPTATALIVSTRQSPSAGSGVGPTSSMGSSSSSSTPARRSSNGPRKSPIAKPGAKAVVRRSSTGKDGKLIPGEKKVGRRRGPLLPEQRKQASEIRKLRACLRCKFLKKTCDKGEPCAGCQPSHARLWQVPCTRIDIKDVGFFMKDWRADYERHLDVGMSVYNVKGFAKKERLMWITHGYGFCLPVMVREVMVADESCFQLDWVESYLNDQEPIDFGIRTESLDVGEEGISMEKLSTYLDHHIDGTFETFVDDHFEGTPFVTEVLKTAHRYYMKDQSSVIRKALKLVLAYNLTMHITLVEQQGSENPIDGQIDDEDSKYFGKTVAPVMINFQIKCAMADMWRELQKEILEELSGLYSRVYSGDRLKNWPTIFMLAAILLIVWEEMQFDCHYRVPDINSVQKFCGEMEGTPVGVIVGLFHAISQKLPAFTDWDTEKHGQVLNNNVAVCEAMTDMRQHIAKHDTYLRSRQNNTEFDRHDFDSLSNKFLSKLVIRAN